VLIHQVYTHDSKMTHASVINQMNKENYFVKIANVSVTVTLEICLLATLSHITHIGNPITLKLNCSVVQL